MRTPKEIKRKIKDLRYRYFQKLCKKFLIKRPENCKFNFRQPLKGENNTIGLCIPDFIKNINQVEWQGIICDHPEDAKDCSRFICRYTKKRLSKDLDQEILNDEICKEKYKDIYVLRWVLSEYKTFFQRIVSLFKRDSNSLPDPSKSKVDPSNIDSEQLDIESSDQQMENLKDELS